MQDSSSQKECGDLSVWSALYFDGVVGAAQREVVSQLAAKARAAKLAEAEQAECTFAPAISAVPEMYGRDDTQYTKKKSVFERLTKKGADEKGQQAAARPSTASHRTLSSPEKHLVERLLKKPCGDPSRVPTERRTTVCTFQPCCDVRDHTIPTNDAKRQALTAALATRHEARRKERLAQEEAARLDAHAAQLPPHHAVDPQRVLELAKPRAVASKANAKAARPIIGATDRPLTIAELQQHRDAPCKCV